MIAHTSNGKVSESQLLIFRGFFFFFFEGGGGGGGVDFVGFRIP